MTLRPLLLMLATTALLAGCVSEPRRVVVKGDVGLDDMVDQRVEFTGPLQGPAKLGDFLTVKGRPVYLDALSGTGRYGQRATVAGTLRRFVPPTAEDCKDGCENADVPPHYWIEGGRFVTPAPGTQ
jgi:hypothetical protein